MKSVEQAVVLCGGLGTRLRPLTDSLPKPMVPVNDEPFLKYLLEQLSKNGIKKFLLLTGYQSEVVEDYFKDGSQFGWEIEYSTGPAEWDTGRRVYEAKEKLEEVFLLLYSDNYVEFDLGTIEKIHDEEGFDLTLTLAKKNPGNIQLGEGGRVCKYDRERSGEDSKYVEIGYMIVKRDAIWEHLSDINSNFSVVIESMAAGGLVGGYTNPFQYRSISDPERLELTANLLTSKKILLIDRDGLLNEKAPRGEYVDKWENFRWIKESVEALKKLSQKGFRFVVISNQAGIGRGVSKQENVDDLHRNMIRELGDQGVHIDHVYVCPHHWEENCFCRKPSPGSFVQANREYDIRMDHVLYVGDDPRDCQAARNAGCKSVFVGPKDELEGLTCEERPIAYSSTFLDLVETIEEYYAACS